MKKLLYTILLLFPFLINAQLIENFSDGDFTSNPTWVGTIGDFTVNTSYQLQTNADVASTSYLSTPNLLANITDKEWHFTLKQSFSGSSSNYTKIYLTADNTDLNAVQNGYYLLFGEAGSSDAIKLFKIVGGSESLLLTGTTAAVAGSFNVGVRIIHKTTGEWELYTDYAGGENYSLEAQTTDPSTIADPNFGIYTQYTVSNIKKIYLSDIYVGNIINDTIAPKVSAVNIVDNRSVQVTFSEPVDAQIKTQTLTTTPANAVDSIVLNSNPAIVTVFYHDPFSNGTTYTSDIPSVKDLSGNDTTLSFDFTYMIAETPATGDVIITEFMADPTPAVGLPEVEYIEIYNRSSKYFELTGWKLGNNSSFGTISAGWLAPGAYAVLTSTSNTTLFSQAIGVTSFPSFKNAGDDIILQDNNLNALDKLTYDMSWYKDPTKQDGGYSIERMRLGLICSDGSNWRASVNPLGGTPGAVNSVNDTTSDVLAPTIISAVATSDSTITVTFSEPVDGNLNLTNFSLSNGITITQMVRDTSSLARVFLQISPAMSPSQSFLLTIHNFADCQGNTTSEGQITIVLPDVPQTGDIILNELLFNPLTGGSDFIELKNRSQKIINLKGLLLSNTKTGSSNNVQIAQDYLLFPGKIVCLTPDTLFLKQNYPFTGNFLQTPIITMNNDISTVILSRDSTVILDSVTYSSKWHFKLITDQKGKSLERVNANAPTSDPNSWHTASKAYNYASPGLENSESTEALYSGKMTLSAPTISPDNDGFQDILTISYEMDDINYSGTVNIYDDRGRLIRHLVNNELLGTQGTFTWDGLDDSNQKVNIGTHVIVFEGFNLNSGKKFKLKKVVVVAGDR